MNFEQAIEHLKQGSIITRDSINFFYIEGKRVIAKHIHKDDRRNFTIAASFYSDDILSNEWRTITLFEENQLQLRG